MSTVYVLSGCKDIGISKLSLMQRPFHFSNFRILSFYKCCIEIQRSWRHILATWCRRPTKKRRLIFVVKRDCKGKMKGGIEWKLITLALDRDPWKLYLIFLSREIDIQLCQIYTKINIYTILYKSRWFK